MKQTSCIILAGGKGKRMGGSDKGLLQYRGKRLIEHALTTISPQVDDIIISANRHLDIYKTLGHTVITDSNDNFDGPLAGIASAIPHCKHDWVLVIPCDMPSLPDTLVSTMIKNRNASTLVVISSKQRLQLIFLLHRNLLGSIRQFLSANQHSVMQWVDSVEHDTVIIKNETYFHNINSQDQLDSSP